MAEVFNGHSDGASMTAESTSGSQENIRRLDSGELDFALSNSAITYFAVRGTEGWDQAYPMRAVMTLAPNVAMFVVPAGSDVNGISDLTGKRVSVGPAGAGFEYFVRPLLAAHGITAASTYLPARLPPDAAHQQNARYARRTASSSSAGLRIRLRFYWEKPEESVRETRGESAGGRRPLV